MVPLRKVRVISDTTHIVESIIDLWSMAYKEAWSTDCCKNNGSLRAAGIDSEICL